MKRSLYHSGFTYIELVIALSIVALTLAFAGPSLDQYSKTQKISNTAREIYTNLQLARMTAIKENKSVVATLTLTQGASSMTLTDSSGAVIPEVKFYQETPDINLASNVSGPAATTVTYTPMGTVPPSDTQTITVSHNDPAILTTYDVVINASGGVRIAKN